MTRTIRFPYSPRVDVKLRHLRLVRAVADTGQVGRAARRLRVSQPAVSQGLKELERGFGVPLFVRREGRMTPTEGGRRLIEAADRVLRTLDDATRDLEELGAGSRGVLRIATECYTCYHWLPPILEDFRRSWPGFEVRIVAEATDDPAGALRRGELDLAIAHSLGGGSGLATVPLFRDEQVAVLPPGHPLADRTFLRPSDFAMEDLILHSDYRGSVVHQRFLLPAGVEPRRVSLLRLTEAVLAAVRAGLGISALARWAVAPELAAGRLVGVRLGESGVHRDWSACFLAEGRGSRPLGALVGLLEREAAVVAGAAGA